MKALEFQTKIQSLQSISIPVLYQKMIKKNQQVKVIVLIQEKTDEDNDALW